MEHTLTFAIVSKERFVSVSTLTSWLRAQALVSPVPDIRDVLAEVSNMVETSAQAACKGAE